MFKTWKKSMMIRYILDAISLILLGVILQYLMGDLLKSFEEW